MNSSPPTKPRSPELREEIKAAQAANTKPDDHDYDEATTRDVFIDVLLGQAGWVSTGSGVRLEREYRVASMGVSTGSTTEKVGYADYVLWGADGLPLAVVEAKRTKKSAAIGQQQAKLYADCLEKRVRPTAGDLLPTDTSTGSGMTPDTRRARCRASIRATSWS
jgi:predicted type IV restriction endonuclease